MEVEDAGEFFDRFRVIIDPQIAVPVVGSAVAPAGANDEEGGGLAAAAIAPGLLAGAQGGDQAIFQKAGSILERLRHGGQHLFGCEQVSLDCKIRVGEVSRFRGAFFSGEGNGRPGGGKDGYLAVIHSRILALEKCQDLVRRGSVPELAESCGAEGDVGKGLGGNGTHARRGEGYDGTHGDDARFNGDAEFTGLGIPGHDGEGVDGRSG